MQESGFKIEGLKLFTPQIFNDERGFFTERFNQKKFSDSGLTSNFVQDNFSRSKYKVLRGLHYQTDPAQSKLVTCLRGQIFDVAVDLREGSATYGQYESVVLNGDTPSWFWIPAGFAHGFCVTSEEGADVMYKVNAYWNPKTEITLRWDNPKFNIQWPFADIIMSEKDKAASSIYF